jgi:hypothetical protein
MFSRMLSKYRMTNWNDMGPLYHDYSLFGVRNQQLPGIFGPNQKCKAPIISAYIQLAIAKSRRKSGDLVSFTELFCADAYYAMLALKFGADKAYGVDNNRDNYSVKSTEIAKRLKYSHYKFVQADVSEIDKLESTDVVANVGGLYHVSNPQEILALSYGLANKYLIVQSVVSLATSDPNYFVTPAPDWSWGSRYSRQSFDKMIRQSGWSIISHHFNELEGNERKEDRGSVYYLVEK